jgi:hypothetical protein
LAKPAMKRRAARPISGNISERKMKTGGDSPTRAEETWSAQWKKQPMVDGASKKWVPFIAEYIAAARIPLRAEVDATSEVIGYI